MISNLEITKISDVQEEAIRFLVEPQFPLGTLVICAGDGNVGKSNLLLAVAAALTNGVPLPWERDQSKRKPVNVLFQSAEDGLADTIKPRLMKLKANCDRVHSINDGEYPLIIGDPRIEEAIIRTGAKLLVLDPISSFVENYAGANNIRPQFIALADMAARMDCCVCGIAHLNKRGGKAQYRTLGSVDVTAVARSVITVGKLPDDEEIRCFIHSKSNLTAPAKPQAFGFDEASGLIFLGSVDITLDELLDGEYDKKRKEKTPSKRDGAKDFITTTLSNGAAPAAEMKTLADSAGISKNTLERAKSELGVKSFQRQGEWFWTLPDNAEPQTAAV
jgi:RecA-family ATPase